MRWLLALWAAVLCLTASVPPALATGPVAIAAAPDDSAPASVPTEEDRPSALSHILEEQAGPGGVAIKAAEPVRDRTAPSGRFSASGAHLPSFLTVTGGRCRFLSSIPVWTASPQRWPSLSFTRSKGDLHEA